MATPDPIQNEPSKLRRIMNAPQDESIMSRLPRGNGTQPVAPVAPVTKTPVKLSPARTHIVKPTEQPIDDKSPRWRWKFLPAFWTIASVMSFTVNIVVLIVLLLLFMRRNSVSTLATDEANQLLGGLYNNFVLMDMASIEKDIVVKDEIPLSLQVPVNLSNQEIILATDAVINRAHVEIYQGGVNINAPAKVTLPAGTRLNINLSFVLPVQGEVPVDLKVPVTIPLNETDLHIPFVGLQEVVQPWYCLTEPNAVVNQVRVCDNVANPLAPFFQLMVP